MSEVKNRAGNWDFNPMETVNNGNDVWLPRMVYAHFGDAHDGSSQTTEEQAKMNREGFSVLELQNIYFIQEAIRKELERASHSYGPFNSPHEGYAVIKEEVDEMWDDIKTNNFAESKKEAIQVAAMCVRYILDVRTE